MKIIEQPRAPNPRRVHIFLAEKGLTVPVEAIDITKDEHKTDGYRQLNPFAQVPTLVLDDGSTITESVAICRYFEELQPAPPLFGQTAREKADVEMWNRRAELGALQLVSFCFRHLHPAMAGMEVPQVPAWGEVNRDRLPGMLALFDAALGDRPFVAGKNYSIADITLLVAIDFMKPARLARPPGLAHLDRWYDEVSARPSAAAGKSR